MVPKSRSRVSAAGLGVGPVSPSSALDGAAPRRWTALCPCVPHGVCHCTLGNAEERFGTAKPGLSVATVTQAWEFIRAYSLFVLAPK